MFLFKNNWLSQYASIQNQKVSSPTELIPRHSGGSNKRWLKRLFFGALAVLGVLFLLLMPAIVNAWMIFERLEKTNDKISLLLEDASTGKMSQARSVLGEIEGDLIYTKDKLSKLGPILWVPAVGDSVEVISQLLQASSDLLSGYGEMISIFDDLEKLTQEENIAFNFHSVEGKRLLLKSIKENRDDLERAKIKIRLAKNEVNAINAQNRSGLFKKQIVQISDILTELINQSDLAMPLFKYLPELAGYQQEKVYLILFQNNMELRPTGGFIGSYGLLKIKDGEIISLVTDDIYNLDKQSIGKMNIAPPWPMTTYNNQKNWFLRDANWSPDWPTSARQIVWFWDEERKHANLPAQSLDGVIAITPDFIANFLDLTGPLTVDGITFNSNNFAIELEKIVEFDYVQRGIATENRKDIIGDLSAEMIRRFYQLSPMKMLDLWRIMKKNIDEKQIIAWLSEAELQNYFSSENWSGEVKGFAGDYFYLVDANLGALKTDQVIKRKINYTVAVNKDKKLAVIAKITYNHLGSKVTDLITRYRTYARIYVPEGVNWSRIYTIDDSGQKQYQQQEIEYGKELGKSYAGVFLTVEPGKNKTLVVEYILPNNLQQKYAQGDYGLLIQKQPGTAGHQLEIALRFDNKISAYLFNKSVDYLRGGELGLNWDLLSDRVLNIKLR